jgi:hypothetical protein
MLKVGANKRSLGNIRSHSKIRKYRQPDFATDERVR